MFFVSVPKATVPGVVVPDIAKIVASGSMIVIINGAGNASILTGICGGATATMLAGIAGFVIAVMLRGVNGAVGTGGGAGGAPPPLQSSRIAACEIANLISNSVRV